MSVIKESQVQSALERLIRDVKLGEEPATAFIRLLQRVTVVEDAQFVDLGVAEQKLGVEEGALVNQPDQSQILVLLQVKQERNQALLLNLPLELQPLQHLELLAEVANVEDQVELKHTVVIVLDDYELLQIRTERLVANLHILHEGLRALEVPGLWEYALAHLTVDDRAALYFYFLRCERVPLHDPELNEAVLDEESFSTAV